MAERITGQALYEIHREANSELAYAWNDLPPYDRMVYVEVAIVLNGTYLAPLQGLVRDLEQTFIADSNIRGEKIERLQRENDACKAVLTSWRVFVIRSRPGHIGYDQERVDLLRLTAQLLGAEQKEE